MHRSSFILPLFMMVAMALLPAFVQGDAASLLCLVNQERQKAGVAPLALNRTPGQRIAAAGYTGTTTWGENIAQGQRNDQEVMNAWMNSAEHRANILKAQFTEFGSAHCGSKNYWVQNFGNAAKNPNAPICPGSGSGTPTTTTTTTTTSAVAPPTQVPPQVPTTTTARPVPTSTVPQTPCPSATRPSAPIYPTPTNIPRGKGNGWYSRFYGRYNASISRRY